VDIMKAIVAHAHDKVIGVGNKLPWHIPEDLRFFKKYTIENPELLMGKNTYLSLGRDVLPGRNIHILSSTVSESPHYNVFRNVEEVLSSSVFDDLVVCGGMMVYRELLPFIDELIVTEIDLKVEGDTFFPSYTDQFMPVETIEEADLYKIKRWARIECLKNTGEFSTE